jgi:hypothetical protein
MMGDKLDIEWPRFTPLASLFSRQVEFPSVEAWDWYCRGCPDGESIIIPGLLDTMNSEMWWAALTEEE